MPSPTQRWGLAREALAEHWLVESGYDVVERNWRGAGGEVDRIAWDGAVLCFIEVRARSSAAFGSPAATVDLGKQRRLIRAAAAYLGRLGAPAPMVRFDVVAIVDQPGSPPDVQLIRNAFSARLG